MTSLSTEARKPRLLVLASTYPRWPGDHEPGFVHELSRRLASRFEVMALCPHAPGAATRESMDGVDVRRFRYAPARLETLVNDGGIITNLRRQPWKWLLVPGFIAGLLWSAWSVVRRERPDLIHAHWLLPQGLACALLRVVDRRTPPFLVTSHGADLFALRSAPLQWLKRFVLHRCAAATVVSSSMRDRIREFDPRVTKVMVQPMGVDLMGHFIPDQDAPRARNELLFVGRLVEKKGLRYLLAAMPAILESHPDTVLKIAGFGPDLPDLQEQADRLGLGAAVIFLGAVPQAALPALYRNAAVFVAPFVEAQGGDQEGLGLVLVEALGCGCPVVTTRIPAIREVFGGEWPEFVAFPRSAESLAMEVMRALAPDDTASTRRKVDVEALRARFDWQAVAASYTQILASMLPQRP